MIISQNDNFTKFLNDSAWFRQEKLKKHVFSIKNLNIQAKVMQNHLEISSETQFWTQSMQNSTKSRKSDMSGPAKTCPGGKVLTANQRKYFPEITPLCFISRFLISFFDFSCFGPRICFLTKFLNDSARLLLEKQKKTRYVYLKP